MDALKLGQQLVHLSNSDVLNQCLVLHAKLKGAENKMLLLQSLIGTCIYIVFGSCMVSVDGP